MKNNSRLHLRSSNEHVAAAKLNPAHIASPFAAMRRHSLKKKNQKIVDGKTIKDPAFKALFLDILGLENFLQNMNTQALQLLQTMGPFCLSSLTISEMVCDFKSDSVDYEKDTRFYHAVVSSSMGSQSGDGFQSFVEEMEDMVFTPIKMQLDSIDQLKLKLVERESLKIILEKKEKRFNKIRSMKGKQNDPSLSLSENEYSVALQDFNNIHQYIFDTMNGLSTHKGSIILNILNGLKKAQLRFFSNATASLRVCVKNLNVNDDRTENISKSDLAKQLDDRAAKSIVKVKDILKQVKLEERQEKAIRKREKLGQRRKKRNGTNIDTGMVAKGDTREIALDEAIVPIEMASSEQLHRDVHSKPDESYTTGDSNSLTEENDDRILKNDAIQVVEPTPLRKRWLEAQENLKTSLTETHAVSDTKNVHESITMDDIKEMLLVVKEKYQKKQISKADKKHVKDLLKSGKYPEAAKFLGDAISARLQLDKNVAREKEGRNL